MQILKRHVVEGQWWEKYLYRDDPYRRITIASGRGAGKTYAMSRFFVLRGLKSKRTLYAARQHKTRLQESSYRNIVDWVDAYGLNKGRRHVKHGWYIRRNSMYDCCYGSTIDFIGFDTGKEGHRTDALKGLHDVTDFWADEASSMMEETYKVLAPTIRAANCTIFLTFNPNRRSDIAWRIHQRILEGRMPNCRAITITYKDNRFWTEELDATRREFKDDMTPEEYRHIWLGQPFDDDSGLTVLPYSFLVPCFKAYDPSMDFSQYPIHAGWDIADAGQNYNAFCVRQGPLVLHLSRFHSKVGPAARRVGKLCNQYGVKVLYWDEGGMGATAREVLKSQLGHGGWGFVGRGVGFGMKPRGEDRHMTRGMKNKEYFRDWGAQLAWTVRLRAHRSLRRRKGDVINPDKCLYFAPEVKLERQLEAELIQPVAEYQDTNRGKVFIEKEPDGATFARPVRCIAVGVYVGYAKRNPGYQGPELGGSHAYYFGRGSRSVAWA